MAETFQYSKGDTELPPTVLAIQRHAEAMRPVSELRAEFVEAVRASYTDPSEGQANDWTGILLVDLDHGRYGRADEEIVRAWNKVADSGRGMTHPVFKALAKLYERMLHLGVHPTGLTIKNAFTLED